MGLMEPYYSDARVTVHAGDCLDVLRELDDASVDAVVCDPPYGLSEHRRADIEAALLAWLTGDRTMVPTGRGGFMGRDWDRFVPPPAVWDECFRVLKPGGHLLAFAGSRTFDLMGISIRLAGLTEGISPEVRDSIAWLYGSGFPKSLDVSKAIDKAAGAEREVVGRYVPPNGKAWNLANDTAPTGYKDDLGARSASMDRTAPATDDARTWQGWGTALKPAFEPIVVARKPLTGTVAANVLAHGTGALNIDACRIGDQPRHIAPATPAKGTFNASFGSDYAGKTVEGRWPANVALDESQAAALDAMSGEQRDGVAVNRNRDGDDMTSWYGTRNSQTGPDVGYGGQGGASRYFYTAKAPGTERVKLNGTAHPTVKPLDLMRWLVRLVTPPGGLVLDPFAGSGTTVEACILEGFRCVAIEREPDYLPLIMQRVNRRIDPVAAVKATAEDGGLFDLLGEETA